MQLPVPHSLARREHAYAILCSPARWERAARLTEINETTPFWIARSLGGPLFVAILWKL